MEELKVLPINKENLRYSHDRFKIDILGAEYIFEIYWNEEGELFTFNLYDRFENPIVFGKRIIYGFDILANIVDERLPKVKIIPLDISKQSEESGISFANFMEEIVPIVVDREDTSLLSRCLR